MLTKSQQIDRVMRVIMKRFKDHHTLQNRASLDVLRAELRASMFEEKSIVDKSMEGKHERI